MIGGPGGRCAPGAEHCGAVFDRLCAAGLRDAGRPAAQRHLHDLPADCGWRCCWHRLLGDLPRGKRPHPTRRRAPWVRQRFGLASDATLHGPSSPDAADRSRARLLLAIAIPAPGASTRTHPERRRSYSRRADRGITISLGTSRWPSWPSIVASCSPAWCAASCATACCRPSTRPCAAPVDDAGLNYVGVIIALLIGTARSGIDFTNLAIVAGALSSASALACPEKNNRHNVISGVFLWSSGRIKAGDGCR